ncbi:MAG: hypothetical protein AAF587_29235 [Bacteroidota bacterium]
MSSAKNGCLKVYVFNVGTGEHILVQLPNGMYGIIDFYYPSDDIGFAYRQNTSRKLGEVPALRFLKDRHAKGEKIRLAFIHVSHPDHDHIKGIKAFLDWIEEDSPIKHKAPIQVDNLWWFGGTDFLMYYEAFHAAYKKEFYSVSGEAQKDVDTSLQHSFLSALEAIKSFSLSHKKANCPPCVDISLLHGNLDGHSLRVFNLTPPEAEVHTFVMRNLTKFIRLLVKLHRPARSPKEQRIREKWKHYLILKNRISASLLFKTPHFKLLFGGDVEKPIWNKTFRRFRSRSLDILFGSFQSDWIKASHHGSKYSSSVAIWKQFLRKAGKSLIAISAGPNKKNNHPHGQTVKDIKKSSKDQSCDVMISATNFSLSDLRAENMPEERMDDMFDLDRSSGISASLRKKRMLARGIYNPSPKKFKGYQDQADMLIALIYEFHSPKDDTEEKQIIRKLGVSSLLYKTQEKAKK